MTDYRLQNPVEVSCEVWEVLLQSDLTTVYSSLTDGSGEFGEPKYFTGLGLKNKDLYIGESTLYNPHGEDEKCVHYVEGRAK